MTAPIWTTIEESLQRETGTARARAQLAGLGGDTADISDLELVEAFNVGTAVAGALLALRHMRTLRTVSRSVDIDDYDWVDREVRADVQAQTTMAAFYTVVRELHGGEDYAKKIYWETLDRVGRRRRTPGREVPVDLHGEQLLPEEFHRHDGPRPKAGPRAASQLAAENGAEPFGQDITVAEIEEWARSRTARERRDLALLEAKYAADEPVSVRELAQSMGLPEDRLETRLRRARARLREAIAQPHTGMFGDEVAAA
ncbi:hypothetical protein OG921_24095 [Aldersonia sp. NBC_00410]|uniref:hypothetical protein n=1 Tax=Aldersonia sp. NBC_00410 TaxID=2975954 RepID=UPI00224E064B|nr:hypothetical protein [Aldersonia sp. NBC_00410]MCX5046257.1 hypothetical protein [Aldersonia sp. NBC_00410]